MTSTLAFWWMVCLTATVGYQTGAEMPDHFTGQFVYIGTRAGFVGALVCQVLATWQLFTEGGDNE